MATGDVTLSLTIEGGVTKTVTLDSATRVLSRAAVVGSAPTVDSDAAWAVFEVNKLANVVLAQANQQAQSAAAWTAKSFTQAT